MRSIILTGSSSGLGKSLHDTLVSSPRFQSDTKIFASRRAASAGLGSPLNKYCSLDLSNPEFDVSCFSAARGSSCIIFISNAGIIDPISGAIDVKRDDLLASLQVNVLAPLMIAQHLASIAMSEGIPLRIVNVSSGAASKPVKGWLAYCVAKASSRMALDVLAAENDLVEVVHFDPGIMDTAMQDRIRGSSVTAMPDVDVFRTYKTANRLRPPEVAAEEIVQIVDEITP